MSDEAALFDAEQTQPEPWWKRRMCGLDIETTREVWDTEDGGPDVQRERIVSCAVALVGGGGETWSHTWLVNPGFPIPPESTAIHGIHTEDVQDAPSWADVAEEILDVLVETAMQRWALDVYNAPFDCTVIDREMGRAGLDASKLWEMLRIVDPMLLDRILDTFRKGSRKLPDTIAIWNARAERVMLAAGREWKATDVLERARGGPHEAAADAIGACRLAWLLARFGVVYTYDKPIFAHQNPDRDMRMRQSDWDTYRDDLDRLHEWQRQWRAQDQLRLKSHWESQGNPKAAGVRPEWPVYPPNVKVG